MSEALTRRGIRVTLIEMTPNVMTTIDPDLGANVAAELERHGVQPIVRQSISAITTVGNKLCITDAGQFSHMTEMVLVAVGALPETELAVAAGVATGVRGALRVNRRMETNLLDVFAAGDCAETLHRITMANAYLPLGTTAHKRGRIAGGNVVGGNYQFEGSLGTQSVRLFDYVVARTGFHDRDAAAAGFDPLSVDSVQSDHKVYYPAAKEMTIRVTGDRTSGKLLGAQIIGHYGTEVSKPSTFSQAQSIKARPSIS